MGLQTCKYFYRGKIRSSTDVHVFEGAVCGVSTLVEDVQGGLVGQILCFPCHLSVILPCKETEGDLMLNYFSVSNLVKYVVKLGVANVGLSSAVYNKTKWLQLTVIFVIVK